MILEGAMILEGLVTSMNADGSANVAPMGPHVDGAMDRLVLRPFQSSATFANLKRTRQGVFHVIDDVELLARAAIDCFEAPPRMHPAHSVDGWVLEDACRWYAFRILQIDERQPRSEMIAQVVDQGRLRDVFGFNRGKHAVLEAAILATRVGIVDGRQIEAEFSQLKVLVEKTGGDSERRAFELLERHVARELAGAIALDTAEQLALASPAARTQQA